jgi:hypothetical protein
LGNIVAPEQQCAPRRQHDNSLRFIFHGLSSWFIISKKACLD